MRIGLTYDLQTDPTAWRQAEFDSPETVAAVAAALTRLGHDVVHLGGAEELLRRRDRLAEVALVFNLAEGSWGRCREAWVPTLLELLDVPYVGSDPLTLALGLDKAMSKRLARASGVATPDWIAIDHPEALPDRLPFTFPAIVKPKEEGSGIGVDRGAVVSDHRALKQRAAWLWERLRGPILIETFIPFGELTVLLIGNDSPHALPVVQRPLDPATRLSCHVTDRESGSGRADWLSPVELTPALEAAAVRMAETMFEVLGCRDMARVDLRLNEAGALFFLEINPLPSFDPQGTVGLIAEHLGIAYHDLIGRILEAALRRVPRKRPCVA